jgi:putative PIG3 family NAD(P)H quinone oxidoreductase
MTAKGPKGLELQDAPTPALGPEEILVRVRASALNRADLLQTLGLYPAPKGFPSDIPGLEYAGEVAAVGARASRWKVGDRVMGLTGGGAWAEELAVHEREAIRVPAGLSDEDAAALPEAFMTAWDAMVLQAGLTRGHTALIHAIASGVGTAAAQLAHAWGARVVGTGRTEAKLARVRALGSFTTVLSGADRDAYVAELKKACGDGANVVLDLVGGKGVGESLAAMAPGGTLMVVGLVAGASSDVNLGALLTKRLTIRGTTLRARPLEEKIALAQAFERQLVPLFESRVLVPVVDAVFPMPELARGLERLSANDSFGKLVVRW